MSHHRGTPRRRPHLASFASCLLVLAGCATQGPEFDGLETPRSDHALLYVYRPASFKDRGLIPHVYLNREHRIDLNNGAYASLQLPPGRYSLEVMGRAARPTIVSLGEIELNLEAGERCFVKWWPELNVQGLAPGLHILVLGKIAIVREGSALQQLESLVEVPEILPSKRIAFEALNRRKRRR